MGDSGRVARKSDLVECEQQMRRLVFASAQLDSGKNN